MTVFMSRRHAYQAKHDHHLRGRNLLYPAYVLVLVLGLRKGELLACGRPHPTHPPTVATDRQRSGHVRRSGV